MSYRCATSHTDTERERQKHQERVSSMGNEMEYV